MNAEKIKVGGYQIVTLLLLSVNFVIVAMSHALSLFYKFTPKFYCQVSELRERMNFFLLSFFLSLLVHFLV